MTISFFLRMVGKERRVRRSRAEQSSPISVPVDPSSFSQIRDSTVPLLAQVGALFVERASSDLSAVYSWTMNQGRRENKLATFYRLLLAIHLRAR